MKEAVLQEVVKLDEQLSRHDFDKMEQNSSVTLIIKDYTDPETLQEFTSAGWKMRFKEDMYGDYVLMERTKDYTTDEFMESIKVLLEQRFEILSILKEQDE